MEAAAVITTGILAAGGTIMSRKTGLTRKREKGSIAMKNLTVWEQLVQLPYLNLYSTLVNAALELDIFSNLTQPVTAGELAAERGWNEANTAHVLGALSSLGFVEQEDGKYRNSGESQRYLVKGGPEYLGGFLLFYGQSEGGVPMDVKKLLREGPQPLPQMEQHLDFSQYGQMLRMSEEGYRQQEILRIVRAIPENGSIRRVLDVGCAAGLLGLAVIGDGPERTGVLFDRIPPQIIQSSMEQAGLADRVQVMQGDFLTDSIGTSYDLILAVSMMVFAKGRMEPVLKKFRDALNPEGVLVVISEGIAADLSGPWDMVTGYLPYSLNGMDIGVKAGEIPEAARRAGFTRIETRMEVLCSGEQDIHILHR